VLVNNVYFCGKKRAMSEGREVLVCRIFQQECFQFLPS